MVEVRLSEANMKHFQIPLELALTWLQLPMIWAGQKGTESLCVWWLGLQSLLLTWVPDCDTVPTEAVNSPEWPFQEEWLHPWAAVSKKVNWISYHVRPQVPFCTLLCKLGSWSWLWKEKSLCFPLGINYNSPSVVEEDCPWEGGSVRGLSFVLYIIRTFS